MKSRQFERRSGLWNRTGTLTMGAVWLAVVGLTCLVIFAIVFWYTPFPPVSAALISAVLIFAVCGWARRVPGPKVEIEPARARRMVAAVIIGGLVLRLLWVWMFPVEQWSDAATYWQLAVGLADKGQYVQDAPGGGVFYAWRPPGLPLILAAMIKVLGPRSWIPLTLNLLLYIASSLLLYSLAVALADRRAAVAAVLLLAVYPAHIAAIFFSETEIASLFVLLWVFWGTNRLATFRPIALIGFGLGLGLAILIRPTFVFLPVILGGYVLLATTEGNRSEAISLLLRAALVIMISMAVVGLWAARNYERLGVPVATTTMGGANFYFANNPVADQAIDRTDRNLFAQGLTEVELGRVGYHWGLSWIHDHPGDALRFAAARFLRVAATSSDQIHWVVKQFHHHDGTMLAVLDALAQCWWLLVWLLALSSLVRYRLVLSGSALAASLYMYAGFLFAVHTVFQSVGRYNMPTAGLIAFLAALVFSCGGLRSQSWAPRSLPRVAASSP